MPSFNPPNPSTEPSDPQAFFPKKPVSPLKPILLAVLGLLLVSGIAYGTYWYGKRQIPPPAPKVSPPPVTEIPEATSPAETDETAGWETYRNDALGYSIKYPANSLLEERTSYKVGEKIVKVVWIDKQIEILASERNPEDCVGDCPIIESKENIKAGALNARKLDGWFGAVGGQIPQSYSRVVTRNNDLYYLLTLHELPYDSEESPYRKIDRIKSGDISLFNQILSTFRFLE